MQQLGGGAGVHPFQPSLASDPPLCRARARLALRKATDSMVRVPGLAGPSLCSHLSGADAWKGPLRMSLGTCRWHHAAWPASPRAPAPSTQSRTDVLARLPAPGSPHCQPLEAQSFWGKIFAKPRWLLWVMSRGDGCSCQCLHCDSPVPLGTRGSPFRGQPLTHLPVLLPEADPQGGEASVRAPLDAPHHARAEAQLAAGRRAPQEILLPQLLHLPLLAAGQHRQGAPLEVRQHHGRAGGGQQHGPEPPGAGRGLAAPVRDRGAERPGVEQRVGRCRGGQPWGGGNVGRQRGGRHGDGPRASGGLLLACPPWGCRPRRGLRRGSAGGRWR